jgi:RHS repeat-associated protein
VSSSSTTRIVSWASLPCWISLPEEISQNNGRSNYNFSSWHSNNCDDQPAQILPHVVKQIGSQKFWYDHNGNPSIPLRASMIRRIDENNKDWTYTWTVDNRLARATTAGGDDVRFVYDADGAMVLRNDNGQRTVFLGNLYQRNLSTGAQTKHYLFGGKLVAVNDGSLSFLLTDHLGSVNVTLNADGTIRSRLRYDPWGKQRYAQNNTPTDYRYTAQRFDAKLGIYDYRARYYDPYINRFISADTIVPDPANPQSLNRYSYVLNNPLRFTDPTGHYCYDPSSGADLMGTCVREDGTTYYMPPVRPDGISPDTWAVYMRLWSQLTDQNSSHLLPDGRLNDRYLIAILIDIEIKDARAVEPSGRVYRAALEAISYQYHGWACSGACSSLQSQLKWMDAMHNWRERGNRDLPINVCDHCMADASLVRRSYNDGDGYQAVWWGNPYRDFDLHNYIIQTYPQANNKPYALIVDNNRFIVGFRGTDEGGTGGILNFVVITRQQQGDCYATTPNCMGFSLP